MRSYRCLWIAGILGLLLIFLPLASFGAGGVSDSMTPLEGLTPLGGSWQFGEKITSSGSGDLFALSEVEATSFILETTATFNNKTGAASLMFFASDNPSRGSYIANIDLGAGNARIFAFTSGGAVTKGEFRLTSEMKGKNSFRLRVEALGEYITYFIDGTPVITLHDASKKPGKALGLLTFNTSVTYSELRYAILDSKPTLNEVITPTGALTPSLVMDYRVPFGTTALPFSVSAEGSVSARATDGTGVTVKGNSIAVDHIENSFSLILSVTKGEITVNYILKVHPESDPDSIYNEEWRSQFHFSPFVNWLNDPNGLVYDPSDESYHLFFQYNPFGLNIANQVWAHAVSEDLVNWKEVGIAIDQDHLGAVFSGSAVVDEDNTTGFFTDNKPGESKLVAIFTSDGGDTTYGVEKQCIAYSKDHGITWTRPTLETHGFENPILKNENNKYGRDFRDPKIFRYDGKWFMVIAGGRARLFTSDNLIDWTPVCDMGFDSECPDFYPLAVDGDSNNMKWVYTASGKWYVVGRLEKVSDSAYRFVAEGDRITYNGGSEVYATQSFYNDGSGNNRRIAISWIQDHSAESLDGKTWNGAMTLPYEQTLRTVNGRVILCSYPVEEVNRLHGEKLANLRLPNPTKVNAALSANPGVAYDMEMSFTHTSNGVVSLTLASNGKYATRVIYDCATNRLRVVRGQSGSATGSIPTSTMEMPLYADKDEVVTLRILMDRSVIEVFGNGGEASLCGMIFPDGDCINASVEVKGDTLIEDFAMWEMRSIWHDGRVVRPEEGIYFECTGSLIAVDDRVTVTAYYINEEGKREDALTLEPIDSKVVRVVSNQGPTATLHGIDDGSVTLRASVGNLTGSYTVTVAESLFDTNLEGWQSKGDWHIDEKGYSIAGSSGDSFSFSSVKNQGEFVYRGIADLHGKGGCLGLVFSASKPADPSGGVWYGANIDTHGDRPVMKLFCNQNGSEVWNKVLTLSEWAEKWELVLTYKDGVLTFAVNGNEVSYKLSRLTAGTLGLVSWNGGGSFDRVYYEKPGEAEPPVTTPDTEKVTPDVTPDSTASGDIPDEPDTGEDDVDVDDGDGGDGPLPWIFGAIGTLVLAGVTTGYILRNTKGMRKKRKKKK